VSLKARVQALEVAAAEAQGSPLSRRLRRAYAAALRGEELGPDPALEPHENELIRLLIAGLEAVPVLQRAQMAAAAARS
jgi:hypothetical protein